MCGLACLDPQNDKCCPLLGGAPGLMGMRVCIRAGVARKGGSMHHGRQLTPSRTKVVPDLQHGTQHNVKGPFNNGPRTE